jgi:4-alpha-glucanotransferase
MKSKANLVVIPIQDYLELTNEEGRINTPSIAVGNWDWRISKRYKTASLSRKIRKMTERGGRAVK